MTIQDALNMYGDLVIQKMTDELESQGSIDFYKSFRKTTTYDTLEISMPIAGFYIDGGRGTNKTPPPVNALLDWLDRVAIPHEARFAVAKHIGKVGIPPKPFLNQFEDNINILENALYLVFSDKLTIIMKRLEREV